MSSAAGGAVVPALASVSAWSRLNLVDDVRQIFEFHFMVNAYAAGTASAVLAGALGWFMVLRRQSFAGHSLAVVSFPGAAGAVLIGADAYLGYFAGCVAGALVMAAASQAAGNGGIADDRFASAGIGTIQAFFLACGLLFVTLYQGFLSGTTALLFGSFLGVTDQQVVVLVAVAVAVLVVLTAIGRPLLFSSIDRAVADARGVPVRGLDVAFLVLLGVAVAAAAQITGALLVFALLVMPAASAQRVTAAPGRGLALSVGLAVAITWLGLGIAFYSVYPIGFYVTTLGFAVYLSTAVRARLAPHARRIAGRGEVLVG